MRARRSNLPKALDPFLEARQRVAQLGDRSGVAGLLLAPHQEPRFLGEEIRRRGGDALRRIDLPCGEPAGCAGDAVRGHVPHQAREFLLDLPAQVPRERGDFLREPRVAVHLDGAQERFFTARQREQRPGTEPQGETRRVAARLQAPALDDGHAHGRQRCGHQLHRFAGERREALARPRLRVEKAIDEKAKGHRGGGLFAGQGAPQCICWMPARSQPPPAPCVGLTRFQTSSNPTGSLCGVSRTRPEKRTLAQWWSCSVATSSRSAFSETTSVCCASAGRASTSLRSASNISSVVKSRISSSLPASFAICSLTKLSFAARRNAAASKPAGSEEGACNAPIDAG